MATWIEPAPLRRKKILVLISRGGGGHVAAGDAVKEILGHEFDVSISNVLTDILPQLDPLHKITGGKYTGEDLYNYLLQRHYNRIIQFMSSSCTFHMKRPRMIEKSFTKYFSQIAPPDMIISHTPFINYGVLLMAEKRGIPFLLIPTDLDGSTFLQGFPKIMSQKNFKIGLAYDDPEVRRVTLGEMMISEEMLATVGFPIRPAYLRPYTLADIERLKEKHGLLETHATATIIMGALGGNLILEHAKTVAAFDPRPHDIKLQVNVCTGRNEEMRDAIARHLRRLGADLCGEGSFKLPNGLIFHIRGFMKEIVEIMAASDLIITKTGSCTVNEAIYLQKPVLLDNTAKSSARYLRWEQFNVPFVHQHNLGAAFTDAKQLHMLIPSILKFPQNKQSKKPFELPHFASNIRKIVREMI